MVQFAGEVWPFSDVQFDRRWILLARSGRNY
jgi:hypothetical protein